jgi:hypothetical protein
MRAALFPRSARNAAHAALGFSGSSTGFPVGLSPTPLAHVSASPLCDSDGEFPQSGSDFDLLLAAFYEVTFVKPQIEGCAGLTDPGSGVPGRQATVALIMT